MNSKYKISLADERVSSKIFTFLEQNLIFSGYILPNINDYGFNNCSFFKLFYSLNDKNEIFFIGSMYFDTMHIICFDSNEKFVEILVNFICHHCIKRITGNMEIIKKIDAVKKGIVTTGLIFLLDMNYFSSPFNHYSCVKAKIFSDFLDISRLLRNDSSFRKNYASDEILANQLFDRYKSNNGRTYFYENDKNIIATVSTYSECESVAVISGVFTKSGFKGKGIGTYLLSILKNELVRENKNAIIYFFNIELTNFYDRLGVSKKTDCAKIEFF